MHYFSNWPQMIWDLAAAELKGPVRQVTTITRFDSGHSSVETLHFNSSGKVIAKSVEASNGTSWAADYRWGSGGPVTKLTYERTAVHHSDQSRTELVRIRLPEGADSKKLLRRPMIIEPGIILEVEYDASGFMRRTIFRDPAREIRMDLRTDTHGNIVEVIESSAALPVLRLRWWEKLLLRRKSLGELGAYLGAGPYGTILCRYDGQSRMIERISETIGFPTTRHMYSYNEHGDVVEFSSEDGSGPLRSSYEYDAVDNWIFQRSQTGEYVTEVRRDLKYFPEP